MAMTKLTSASKTSDSPVDYETINDVIAEMKELYDAVTAKHTTAGIHSDDLLPRGRGRITFSGGTPTLAQNWGIVASITDTAAGVTKVTISTASSATTGVHIDVACSGDFSQFTYKYVVNDTTNVTIYTYDAGTLGDIEITFAVWID